MKIVIDIPEKTIAHIRSDYGHGIKCIDWDSDKDIIVDAIWNCVSLEKWLSSFNTESATCCFTAVQELKKKMEDKK